ncbi:MAG TPA: hypothetical protein VF800_18830 [Telluria sp.]|jgi:hypothetical protein
MRFFKLCILIAATLLSFFGFIWPLFLLIGAAESSYQAGARAPAVAHATANFVLSCAAWVVYFRMSNAWVAGKVLSPRWPLAGLVLGIGSLHWWSVRSLQTGILLYTGILVLPAIALACWVSVFHLWKYRHRDRPPPGN